MIKREIENQIKILSKVFPVIAITGAIQTGKTTFLKYFFKKYKYYNLETPSTLTSVEADPKAFIHQQNHIIIDEIQRFPALISYIQEVADERKEMADFIVSGSENLIISEKISQTLAGRVGYVKMYPFSFSELMSIDKLDINSDKQIFNGFMPALYDRNIPPVVYYDQYIMTYLERDLRQLSSVHNLNLFRKFLALLAGRIGQLSNFTSLANDVGVDVKTIERWISILEASYLIFQLQPYYENYGKRFIKSSKIYFSDTGLACRLLGINSVKELKNHYLVGNLFENMIVINLLKELNNKNIN
jgi:predicted AAA+ superfamily ATPase